MAEFDDWDRHWDRYSASASRNPAQRMRHRLAERLLGREDHPGRRILDIGSGQGDLLAQIRRSHPAAVLAGFELSRKGVEASRQKVPDARFVVADLFDPPAEALEYRGWATDAICSEVLEHVDEPGAFVLALKAYLAPGARLIVTVPGGPMSAFDRHIGHRRHFTRESIRDLLTRSGLAVERVYRAGFPFFNLYRGIVIARGAKLAADVDGTGRSAAAPLADLSMAAFRGLFQLNLNDSPWGWQLVAAARNEGNR